MAWSSANSGTAGTGPTDPLDQGDAEGQRLARAGRRLAAHVPAGQGVRQRRRLDGEGLVDAPTGQAIDDGVAVPARTVIVCAARSSSSTPVSRSSEIANLSARGVARRTRSATNAAASSMMPELKVATSPACQAMRAGSGAPAAVASALAGSITRKTWAMSETVLMP